MTARALTLLLTAAAAFGQEPVVGRETIWIETVKRGDMPLTVRGRGVITGATTAELNIPAAYAKQVQPGQTASIDTKQGVVAGKVARVNSSAVVATLEGNLPAPARPGMAVDGTIHIGNLSDVVYVGRPVQGQPESEGTIFKLEPNGGNATRVRVQFGRSGANVIEIRNGLQPGDKVILSDMSAHANVPRVRLQ